VLGKCYSLLLQKRSFFSFKKIGLKKYLNSYWIRSAYFSFLQRFSLIFFGLINFILLARVLPTVSEMGTWALFLTITTLAEITKSALLKNAHIKFVSGKVENDVKSIVASSSLIINLSLTLIYLLLIVFFGKQLAELLNSAEDLPIMLNWFLPGLVAMAFFAHFEAVQQSHFDFKGVFAGNLVRQSLFFVFIAIHFITHRPLPLHLLPIYLSISIVVGTIVLYFYSKKYLLHRFNPSLQQVKELILYGGYIFGSSVLSAIFSNLDQLLTATFLSTSSVGYYNAAKRINGFIDIPTYAGAEILFPKMSQASEEESGLNRVKNLYEKMVSLLLCFIIPVAFVIILIPKLIILILAGEKYTGAALVLQIYMVISIVGTLQHQAATALDSVGKTRLTFFVNLISLFLKLGITYACLFYFGFYGAAYGALITAVITSIIWYFLMKQQVGFSILSLPHHMKFYYLKGFENLKTVFNR
jgi:O-antigen/teichoic acid export membrane protein